MADLNLKYEKILSDKISFLKKNCGLKGIKAEFEAEGSSKSDVQRLKKICMINNVGLYVKIGGVEAVGDIHNCIEIGVNGIIAPMVETNFAAKKFLDCIEKFDLDKIFHLSINIESKTGFKNYKSIIKILGNKINNITIGRSDLSASFFKENIKPDSKAIKEIIKKILQINKNTNLTTTVGGGVSKKTFEIYKSDSTYTQINKIETRKVIMDNKIFFKDHNIIKEALDFEKKYILYKQSFFEARFKEEFKRLTSLKDRI